MKLHESVCTKNPNRVCRMCALGDLTTKPLGPAIDILRRDDDRESAIGKVMDYNGGCPACTLAAIRQCGVSVGYCDPETGSDAEWPASFPFDYVKAKEEYLHDVNAKRAENYTYY